MISGRDMAVRMDRPMAVRCVVMVEAVRMMLLVTVGMAIARAVAICLVDRRAGEVTSKEHMVKDRSSSQRGKIRPSFLDALRVVVKGDDLACRISVSDSPGYQADRTAATVNQRGCQWDLQYSDGMVRPQIQTICNLDTHLDVSAAQFACLLYGLTARGCILPASSQDTAFGICGAISAGSAWNLLSARSALMDMWTYLHKDPTEPGAPQYFISRQIFTRPVLQLTQRRHGRPGSTATRSPTRCVVTSSPTAMTSPEDS